MTNRPQASKPFDPRRGKSRRKEWGRPEPYRTNGVVLAPRRALAGSKNRGVPTFTSKESSNMPWNISSIAALPNIDLRYLAGDALNAQLNGMNPYGDKIVTAMYRECRKRGIKTILDEDGNVYPLVRLRVNEDVK